MILVFGSNALPLDIRYCNAAGTISFAAPIKMNLFWVNNSLIRVRVWYNDYRLMLLTHFKCSL